MARIPQDEIDRIKRNVPIADLVRSRGIELQRHGANDLVGRCPFHEDDTPSLVITPAKNLWHCMGACQTGGDVFAWVMKSEGIRSFRHAYEVLSGNTAPREPVTRSTVPKLGSPISLEMTDEELAIAVVDYYAETARQSPELREYLKKRAIDSEEAIARFRLGFANRTLGLRLPNAQRQDGMQLRLRLQKLGLFRASSGHEHFNGSLVVPIFDEGGNLAQMYGRKITTNLRVGTPLHLYLPGPHRAVWNLDALRESKEIVLCEAIIDALTFWCHGIRNVTTSYGVEGFARAHLEAFKAYGTERVLIAYDHDEAGDRAALKLADQLMHEGIDCYRVEFPRGMDANDYARKMTPADKALALAVRTASLIGKSRVTCTSQAAVSSAQSIDEPVPPLVASSPIAETIISSPAPARVDVASELPLEMRGEEIVIVLGDRTYRIRGMKKNTSYDSLRVSVLLTRASVAAVFLDTVDLASARQRAAFEKQAAAEIGVKEEVVHREMGQILRALESVRAKQIEELTAPKTKPIVISDEDRTAALELLRDPNLVPRIGRDLARCGLVGEETSKLVAYLAATSRKLDRPLAVIIQSSTAAGKTTLMDAVLGCMPPEEVVRYSAITGKALFYIPESSSLKHKILAISEEQGAEQATYALKLLQSEGRLSIASTGKDPTTGRLESQEYHVEGPIMPIMTTTAPEVDEELQNRCIVLTTDEERAQTRAIHERQRASLTIEGLLGTREADHIRALQQNAQRLLRPLLVAIPQAKELTFLDSRTRTRRDHMKYLTLIQTIALLHQYQRPKKTREVEGGANVEYIEASVDDIGLANELAHEVLGRSLDELSPQARKLLSSLDREIARVAKARAMSRCEVHFTQREVREWMGWSDIQVKTHLRRLVEMEYVLVHRGGRGQSFVYELLYDGGGVDGRPFLIGLIDVASLTTTKKWERPAEEWERSNGKWEGSGRGQEAAGEGPGSGAQNREKLSADAALIEIEEENSGKPLLPKPEKKIKSYPLRRTDGGNGRFRPVRLRRRVSRETERE